MYIHIILHSYSCQSEMNDGRWFAMDQPCCSCWKLASQIVHKTVVVRYYHGKNTYHLCLCFPSQMWSVGYLNILNKFGTPKKWTQNQVILQKVCLYAYISNVLLLGLPQFINIFSFSCQLANVPASFPKLCIREISIIDALHSSPLSAKIWVTSWQKGNILIAIFNWTTFVMQYF